MQPCIVSLNFAVTIGTCFLPMKGDLIVFKKSTAALIALILIWGASRPINKLAVPYSPPLLYAGLRALLGGILLTVIIWKTRKRVNWRENWQKYCIGAFFNTILFFGLQTAGLLYLPSGLFSVLVYFQPILLGLFAWLLLGEYLTPVKILGLFLGFVGVAVVSVDGLTVHVSAIGVTLGLLTAVSLGVRSNICKENKQRSRCVLDGSTSMYHWRGFSFRYRIGV